MQIGKIMFYTGLIFLVVGGIFLFFSFFSKFVPFFKLPGDIIIKKENFGFYFPITSSIIISVILTIILNLILKLFKLK